LFLKKLDKNQNSKKIKKQKKLKNRKKTENLKITTVSYATFKRIFKQASY